MSALDLVSRPIAPPSLYKYHREQVVRRMKKAGKSGAISIEGLPEPGRRYTDYDPKFRQCSYFYYLSGVNEPDCRLYIDLESGHSILFYPKIDPENEIWSGPLPTLADIKKKYGTDEVKYTEEYDAFVHKAAPHEIFSLESPILRDVIGEERQIKTPDELKLIKYVNEINNLAYRQVLKTLHPELFEFQVEGEMQKIYYGHNCLYPPFQVTVCSGELCAILHYHKKTRKINDGDLVLIDSGSEYEMFCSDNTRTYPANGHYTPDQRFVYSAVLATQKAVIAAAKPGVSWIDMALLSAKVMAEKLVEGGLLKGNVDEIVSSGALAVFYPHGLGHGLGLDVHEVAGWPTGSVKPEHPHLKYLRLGRILQEGMVMTVEPGCYFIPALYEPAFKDPKLSKYINPDVCRRLQKTVGGVRIEDDIVITADGNLDISLQIPKEIDEVEALMAQK